jgi:hypothetical protein
MSAESQVVPTPRQVPFNSPQRAWETTTQFTVPELNGRQHAPLGTGVGHASGPQTELAPRQLPPSRVHATSVAITQFEPLGPVMQHAPVGAGGTQDALPHTEPAPRHVPPSRAHAAWVAVTQVMPAGEVMQHAPVGTGCGHVSLPHTVLAPRQVPCTVAHAASVSWRHPTVPLAVTQQAPVTGAGQGWLQLVPTPRHVPPCATQADSLRTRQLTPRGEVMQHAPAGVGEGQTVAVQGVPTPRKVPFSRLHATSVS